MRNHFHLVVETPQANLVPRMEWLMGIYTMRYNRRHRLFGHLFAGRYKAVFVDGSSTGYLKTVCDYAHLNPARAGVLPRVGRLSRNDATGVRPSSGAATSKGALNAENTGTRWSRK